MRFRLKTLMIVVAAAAVFMGFVVHVRYLVAKYPDFVRHFLFVEGGIAWLVFLAVFPIVVVVRSRFRARKDHSEGVPPADVLAVSRLSSERGQSDRDRWFQPRRRCPLVALNHGTGRQTPIIDDKAADDEAAMKDHNSIRPARPAATHGFCKDFTVPIGLARADSSVCPAGFEPATSSSGG